VSVLRSFVSVKQNRLEMKKNNFLIFNLKQSLLYGTVGSVSSLIFFNSLKFVSLENFKREYWKF